MLYIGTTLNSYASADLLRNKLQDIIKHKILLLTDDRSKSIVLRYGSLNKFRNDPPNSYEAVKITANKKIFSTVLAEHGVTNTPNFYRKEQVMPERYPVIIRHTLCGYGGEGIDTAQNEAELNAKWRPGSHYAYWVKCSREFRLHCFRDANGNLEIMKLFKKVAVGNAPEGAFPIRNSANGYHFQLRDMEGKYDQLRTVVSSLDFLPHLFVTLDVGWCPETKTYFIFEGNSAPGLNDATAMMYAIFLAKVVFNVEYSRSDQSPA